MSGPVPGTPTPWQSRDDYTTEGFVTIIGNVDGEYIDGQAHCTYDVVCRCEDEFGERLPNVAANVRAIVHRMNNWDAEQAKIAALEAERDALKARVEALVEALESIKRGNTLAIELFKERVRERKDRLTWWAVNILQDAAASARGEADAALALAKGEAQ